ncbi:MAG: PEGA domain-containing protein [Gallionella sp.]|nr:PEGA domain-containing protein [Gallionella sp.]
MNILCQRVLLGACLAALAACSTVGDENNGLLSRDNVLHTGGGKLTEKYEVKNAAVLRIRPYTDERAEKNPRLLGELKTRVFGLEGNELVVDHDVASIATASLRKQFQKAGFPVLEDGSTQASVFELSGVVKTLTLNSRDRDDITIAIETSVTDVATGKVIWSALVSEKNNRFAGVSGDTKADLVDYLNREMRIASDKTVDAVNTLLMATYPALFNLIPGTKTISGVTVLSAPSAAVVPAAEAALVAAPPAYTPHASATMGLLVLSSKPSRAKVYLDGVYYGMTPLRAEIEPGVHSVEVKLEGYKTASEKVSVRRSDDTELELTLDH